MACAKLWYENNLFPESTPTLPLPSQRLAPFGIQDHVTGAVTGCPQALLQQVLGSTATAAGPANPTTGSVLRGTQGSEGLQLPMRVGVGGTFA